MAFRNPTFDELKNDILRDYRNLIPGADTSRGSILNVNASAIASAIWGLYKNQKWLEKNIVPDSPSREVLERWASIFAIDTTGLDDVQLLRIILDRFRRPAAGGNKYDLERWALEVTSSGLRENPLLRAVPAVVSSSLLVDFDSAKLFDGDLLTTGFRTTPGLSGESFSLDYGSAPASIVGFGFWSYTETDAAFKVAYSDDGLVYTEVPGILSVSRLGWNFFSFDSVGARRIWLFQVVTPTTAAADIREAEIYLEGTEIASSATCFPNYLAIGTAHVLIGTSIGAASNKLLQAIDDYLNDRAPVAPRELYVLSVSETKVDIVATFSGALNQAVAEASIANYFASLGAGDPFFVSQIVLILLQNGATNAVVSTPAADIRPGQFEKLVSGSLSITEV